MLEAHDTVVHTLEAYGTYKKCGPVWIRINNLFEFL